LLPSATEIAFALGLGDSLVGVSHECDYPPQARQVTVVVKSNVDPRGNTSNEIDKLVTGSLKVNQSVYNIDLSLFQDANPDLILTQGLCDVCALDYDQVVEAAQSLAQRPKIISLNPVTLSDVLRDISHVGQNTGKKKEAELFVAGLSHRIESVRQLTASSDLRPKVACLEWLDPIYSAGHWVPEMVDIAGGIDGLAKVGQVSKKIGWNMIQEYQPEIIILMPCGFTVERTLKELDLLYKLPGWNELPAIKEGRLFAVNGHAYFNRSGPRLVDGLEILAPIIHPEIFSWNTTPDAARRL
jgi:iron complex transport system substrate-binding protein